MDTNVSTTGAPEHLDVVWHRYVIGCTYVGVPLMFFVPYSFILWIMAFDPEFADKTCYRLMFHLGLCDLLQLMGHFNGGVMTLLQYRYPTQAIKLVGGWMNGGWWGYIWLMFVVAFNRMMVIIQYSHEAQLFSKLATNIYLAIGWVFVVIFYVTCQFDLQGFDFDYVGMTWFYDMTKPYGGFAMEFEFWYGTITIFLSVGCYIVVFSYVRMKHKSMQEKKSAAAQQHARRELAIAVQATLVTMVALGVNVGWNVIFAVVENPGTVIVYLCNCLWLTSSCVNPVIYMILNSKMRACVLGRLGISSSKIVPVVSTTLKTQKSHVTQPHA